MNDFTPPKKSRPSSGFLSSPQTLASSPKTSPFSSKMSPPPGSSATQIADTRSGDAAQPKNFAPPGSSLISSVFAPIPPDAQVILDDFAALVQKVRPLSSKQQLSLNAEIRTLFHFLADERNTRRRGYMNDNALLAAYTRSYHWWNLVRLVKLFTGLREDLCRELRRFGGEDALVCVDLGAGPLTVTTALWLACPELRMKKLIWYCVDRSKNALALGEELYLAAAARTLSAGGAGEPWSVVRVTGELGSRLSRKAHLVTAANVLNELDRGGEDCARLLSSYAAEEGVILSVEPGVPGGAYLLSEMRRAFAAKGRFPAAPCPHRGECPMPGWAFRAHGGHQGKWCNFAFSVDAASDAPKKLRALSKAAGLPKERATLSFLFMGHEVPEKPPETVRIVSGGMSLPGGRIGFYGCSILGLTLVEGRGLRSGDLVTAGERILGVDEKSGAARVVLR